jgi:putative Mg2+ transporter-C (MgtC) family protein
MSDPPGQAGGPARPLTRGAPGSVGEMEPWAHALAGAPVLAAMSRGDLTLHLAVAFGLTYAIGFERELRGAAAGDRTFALVGMASAVIGHLALSNAPNALAGVVTGIGFIGAGVIIHGGTDGSMVRGVTTAATIFLAAAVGAAAGQGQLLLAAEATLATLFLLELPYLHVLRRLDGKYWNREIPNPGDPDAAPIEDRAG